MEKTNGYYMAKYLKSNAVVLACELVIVLLLSVICTMILGGEPVWLAPVLAVVAYLMAEVRFMMAYIATNARHDYEMEQLQAKAGAVSEEQEPPVQADEAAQDAEQTEEPETAEQEVQDGTHTWEDEQVQTEPTLEQQEQDAEAEDFAQETEQSMVDEDVTVDPMEDEDKSPQVTLESIEMELPEDTLVDDMTMQDGEFEKEVLDIGEIG